MDLQTISNKGPVKEIEDVLEIQKAFGNINNRQVSFFLHNDSNGTVSADVARSLDSGLITTKSELKNRAKKLQRKIKSCRTLIPDVISWPSDSDITVLRMKICLSNNLKEKIAIPGDGLHQPNSSSMCNLATLMLQSPQHSKHSIHEEVLFPITSWERPELPLKHDVDKCPNYSFQSTVLTACGQFDKNKSFDNSESMNLDMKSKVARFFRIYFCPCCSCLYNMEKIHDERSSQYNTKTRN
ncbi:unnamed protein product [Leptosia nina]|uniref:Uncharacterized protein n=1 Tax=Leptosia nina TaxID=320188 RepID=A0AAV1J739_9NEOP